MERLYRSARTRCENGFILVTVLLYLLVLTVLSISTMENSILQQKMSNNRQRGAQLFNKADSAIVALEAKLAAHRLLISRPPCVGPCYAHDDWWQQYGHELPGSGKAMRLQYVASPIMQDKCAKIAGQNDMGVQYYRIAVRASDINTDIARRIEVTYASKTENPTSCDDEREMRTVIAGQQSWAIIS